MSFELGQLAQIIHVTDDLASSRRLYGEVLGGESYYEGYSPFEKRDASIFALGHATIEPMAPSDEPGALEMPVGRFLQRFGPRWHSIAVNATGIRALADRLLDAGIRVVGPGGTPVADLPDDGPMSIYTHPKDSHVLVELVDFGGPMMPTSPRLRPDFDAAERASAHPAGIVGLSHVTVVVHDLDAALPVFTDVLGCPVLDRDGGAARVRLGTETVVELLQPSDGEPADALAADGEGVYSVSLWSTDLDRAARHLADVDVPCERRSPDALALDRSACSGARIVLVPAESV